MADAPPEIANLPDYPVRGEDRTSFATKANATVAAMPTAVTEMNALGAWMKGAADEVEAINLISVSNPAPASLTVTVGPGGDYATINAALAYLSQFVPAYKNTYVRATVNQLSGFVMAEQVLVSGIDFGWVSLSSVDAEVTVDHTTLTIEDGAGGYPAFGVRDGGTLPKINTLYRFSAGAVPGDNKNGIYCVRGGYVDIEAGKGVADAGTYGLFLSGSGEAFCDGANFSGAGTTGVYAQGGSIAVVGTVDVSNAGTYGIHSGGAYVYATGADTSGAGTAGTFVEGGGVLIPLTNMTDDDTMATATAYAPASGESVKAYVDGRTPAAATQSLLGSSKLLTASPADIVTLSGTTTESRSYLLTATILAQSVAAAAETLYLYLSDASSLVAYFDNVAITAGDDLILSSYTAAGGKMATIVCGFILLSGAGSYSITLKASSICASTHSTVDVRFNLTRLR